jgi:hypothetical protein
LVRVGGEGRGLDTGIGEGAQVVGMALGAAGNQRDGVALGAEAMSHGHAEPGARADDEENRTN